MYRGVYRPVGGAAPTSQGVSLPGAPGQRLGRGGFGIHGNTHFAYVTNSRYKSPNNWFCPHLNSGLVVCEGVEGGGRPLDAPRRGGPQGQHVIVTPAGEAGVRYAGKGGAQVD